MSEWHSKTEERLAGPAGERGQALAEYSLVLAFIFIVCVIALGILGVALADRIGGLAAAFP